MAEINPEARGAEWVAPVPLTDKHDLSTFDCGNAALNDWLRHRALRAEGRSARAYVLCRGGRVMGYYCLAAGAVIAQDAPGALRRNMPDPIPVMVIGRLALDKSLQGQGLGAALLKDALQRILGASMTVGARAVLVHAIDDEARAFYAAYGFRPFAPDSRTLFLSIKDIAAAMG